MTLATGTKLGPYEILSTLGAGGMGEVYRARDSRLHRDVAIKVLPEFLASDPDRLRRFEQEARAVATLNHPNVLAIYDIGTHNATPFIVTELLYGETLREAIRRGAMPVRKAVGVGVEIARGLAAAHEKGIVHRDLKPENLFLTKDGHAKVLDFGLAKMVLTSQAAVGEMSTLTNHSLAGAVLGTVGYMAPEQVRGHEADHRSDIFSFGTVLYELLTGKRGFSKPTSAETLTAVLNEEPHPISEYSANVSPGLQHLVERCLEKNPERRFQSASDLAFALQELSDSNISSIAAPDSSNSRLVRSRTAWALLAMITMAAVVGILPARPKPAPRVSDFVQLTHDGEEKALLGTDGVRLFLGPAIHLTSYTTAQMPTGGGNPAPVSLPPYLFGVAVSPDATDVLAVQPNTSPDNSKVLLQTPAYAVGALWSVPILGGTSRRIGDLFGNSGAWSPDSKWLAYTFSSDLWIAHADGTGGHDIASHTGLVFALPTWSADGKHLRFTAFDDSNVTSLWEVASDGTGLHPLLPGWDTDTGACCGRWTPNGKYFLFQSGGQIWALPQEHGFFRRDLSPVQLTSSPLTLNWPLVTKDEKKMFRGELVRYDSKSRQYLPFLGGISAESLSWSKDREWIAYVSYPEGTLWRSKADGSEALQLTSPPQYPLLPQWSADGKTLLYCDSTSHKLYTIQSDGGTSRPLLPDDSRMQCDPNWSPDDSKVLFGSFAQTSSDEAPTIRILDLKTRQVSTLPGSENMYSPRWSPDGRYLVALSVNADALEFYDFQSQKWAELGKGYFGFPNWSADGKYVYVLDISSVVRFGVGDRKLETVLDTKGFHSTGLYASWLGLTPDSSMLMLRNAGIQNVYAADWDEP